MIQGQIQGRELSDYDIERLDELLRRDIAENGDGLGVFRGMLSCFVLYAVLALGFLAVFF